MFVDLSHAHLFACSLVRWLAVLPGNLAHLVIMAEIVEFTN